MRADRLVSILMLLQTRGRMTAAEVAAELEISVKTARRDLEALAQAGVPVYSQTGRHGGWQLLGGARTDLSGLTAAEVRALFLIAGPAATANPATTSALRKLMRALPAPFRAAAAAAAAATVLDPAGWGSLPSSAPPHLELLQRAIVEQKQARLDYANDAGVRSKRLVDPLGLVAKGGVWYLVAESPSGKRTFRVDRIREVTITEAPFPRPEGFDLAAEWKTIAAFVETRRTRVRATVLAGEAAISGLRAQFGANLALSEPLADGRIEARISGESIRVLAERLAGWGNTIEVVAPPAVRIALAEIGAELVSAYGEPDSAVRAHSEPAERS